MFKQLENAGWKSLGGWQWGRNGALIRVFTTGQPRNRSWRAAVSFNNYDPTLYPIEGEGVSDYSGLTDRQKVEAAIQNLANAAMNETQTVGEWMLVHEGPIKTPTAKPVNASPRRLLLKKEASHSGGPAWEQWGIGEHVSVLLKCGVFLATHADGSGTCHATYLEAHDALLSSNSPSPWEVVTDKAAP